MRGIYILLIMIGLEKRMCGRYKLGSSGNGIPIPLSILYNEDLINVTDGSTKSRSLESLADNAIRNKTHQYAVNACVGFKNQTCLPLALGTATSMNWVISSSCTASSCHKSKPFQFKNSSTYDQLSNSITDFQTLEGSGKGFQAVDELSMQTNSQNLDGDLIIDQFRFLSVFMDEGFGGGINWSGMLSLNYQKSNNLLFENFINVLHQDNNYLRKFVILLHGNKGNNNSEGELIINEDGIEYDSTRKLYNITWHVMASNNYFWNLKASALYPNSNSENNKMEELDVIVDFSLPFSTIPQNLLSHLVNGQNCYQFDYYLNRSASNEPSIQEYKYKLLACMDNGGDLINENTNKIRLEINNIEYQINEADFLYKIDFNNGSVATILTILGNDDSNVILGANFFEAYGGEFNMENSSMAFIGNSIEVKHVKRITTSSMLIILGIIVFMVLIICGLLYWRSRRQWRKTREARLVPIQNEPQLTEIDVLGEGVEMNNNNHQTQTYRKRETDSSEYLLIGEGDNGRDKLLLGSPRIGGGAGKNKPLMQGLTYRRSTVVKRKGTRKYRSGILARSGPLASSTALNRIHRQHNLK